jgi:predicted AAA+ superfamily ATPase
MVRRLLRLPKRNSILLLGPRGTGKSTLIRESISESKGLLWIDLLKPEEEELYSRSPGKLREVIEGEKASVVVIDEVQKVPKLLDIAHELIEARGVRFILTGSSARKLKRESANLLAGRAFSYRLDPLTHLELKKRFNLNEALSYGLLPKIYFPEMSRPKVTWSPEEKTTYLQTYARTYLREEIQLEQVVRKVEPFRNFLEIAAQMNGKVIEYSNIARDVGVDEKTVAQYFEILEDTLVGFYLSPYHRSVRKRQGNRPKFYLFDPGVKRALDRTLTVPLLPQTAAFGDAFEHFIILEMHKIAQSINPDIRFSFFRTTDGSQEIDLIIERPGLPLALVEIKSSEKIDPKVISKLNVFKDSFKSAEFFVLCRERRARVVEGVKVLPWDRGIQEILRPSSKHL